MSIYDATMPSLKDKIREQARVQAEEDEKKVKKAKKEEKVEVDEKEEKVNKGRKLNK